MLLKFASVAVIATLCASNVAAAAVAKPADLEARLATTATGPGTRYGVLYDNSRSTDISATIQDQHATRQTMVTIKRAPAVRTRPVQAPTLVQSMAVSDSDRRKLSIAYKH
nr:hypothetical protein CFP56_13040 [Quercus suber]